MSETVEASTDSEPGGSLRRDLRLADAVGIGFGAIVGAGIFVVTGVAAGVAGPAFLVGLFIAGIAATANALSSAQLAASYPQSGGTYEYGNRVLGEWPGFVAGWMFLASKIAAAGTVALGLGGYLERLIPGLHPRVVAVGAVVFFTVLNYYGIRRTSKLNLLIVTVSVGTLLAFVVTGAFAFDADNLRPFAPGGFGGTMQAAAILFFAYTGYARIATLGEEVHDPKVTIPRAIGITIGGSILLYGAVALVAVGAIGAAGMSGTAAPLADAAGAFGMPWMVAVIALGGLTAMLGVILSQIMGLSRMAFAMSRRGDLPEFLQHVHPKHEVPGRAILAIGAVAAVVAATGTLEGVATAAAFTILVYYGIANIAALKMPSEMKLYPNLVPLIGVTACALLAISLSAETILTGLAVLATGVVLRLVMQRRKGEAS